MKVCSLDYCDKEVKRRGDLCTMHYSRQYKYGDVNAMKREAPNPNPPEFCIIANCERKHLAKGYCKLHYHRMHRGGNNMDIVKLLRNPDELCLHEKCNRKKRALGYCTMHYQRLIKHGDVDSISYGTGNDPTYVYRLYDKNGKLLYIGITNDIEIRFYAHSLDKWWWNDVAKVYKRKYASREKAQDIELKAIKKYLPPYNQIGKKTSNKKAA